MITSFQGLSRREFDPEIELEICPVSTRISRSIDTALTTPSLVVLAWDECDSLSLPVGKLLLGTMYSLT